VYLIEEKEKRDVVDDECTYSKQVVVVAAKADERPNPTDEGPIFWSPVMENIYSDTGNLVSRRFVLMQQSLNTHFERK
jgi:hypothetical protein